MNDNHGHLSQKSEMIVDVKNQRKERVGVLYMKPISIQITGPFSEDL